MTVFNSVYFANVNSSSSPRHEDEAGEVCIPNISPQERKKRAQFAIRQLIVTLFMLGALVAFGVNPLWRLFLFFMFSAATTSYIQALDKTWVSLASRGLRNISDEEEQIEGQAELNQVRRQARRVIIKGVLIAIPLTILALLIP